MASGDSFASFTPIWLGYNDLTFSRFAPAGHLPSWRGGQSRWTIDRLLAGAAGNDTRRWVLTRFDYPSTTKFEYQENSSPLDRLSRAKNRKNQKKKPLGLRIISALGIIIWRCIFWG